MTTKEESRLWNLEMVRRCRSLYDFYDGKLLHDWAELSGEGLPTLDLLRKEHMLGPARYIGIDKRRKEEIWSGPPEGEDFVLFDNTTLSSWMISKLPTGVLNWDSYHLAKGDLLETEMAKVFTYIEAMLEERQQYVLIINVGLDRGASLRHFQEALEKHGHSYDERYACPYESGNSHRMNYAVIFGP